MATTQQTVNVRSILERALDEAGLTSYQRSIANGKVEAVAATLQAKVDSAVASLRRSAERNYLSPGVVNQALAQSGLEEVVEVPEPVVETPAPVAEESAEEDPQRETVSLLRKILDAVQGRL